MKKEIPESVANAINTIKSFCDEGLSNTCHDCPFFMKDASCLFNRVCPSRWNVNTEKHYYIEYNEGR